MDLRRGAQRLRWRRFCFRDKIASHTAPQELVFRADRRVDADSQSVLNLLCFEDANRNTAVCDKAMLGRIRRLSVRPVGDDMATFPFGNPDDGIERHERKGPQILDPFPTEAGKELPISGGVNRLCDEALERSHGVPRLCIHRAKHFRMRNRCIEKTALSWPRALGIGRNKHCGCSLAAAWGRRFPLSLGSASVRLRSQVERELWPTLRKFSI